MTQLVTARLFLVALALVAGGAARAEVAALAPVSPSPVGEVSRPTLGGAEPLAAGRLGLAVEAGFPELAGRLQLGLPADADVGLIVATLYGRSGTVGAQLRKAIVSQGRFHLAAVVSGSHSVYADGQRVLVRELTGHRPWEAFPRLAATLGSGRGHRLGLEAGARIGFETDPAFLVLPLSGPVPGYKVMPSFPVLMSFDVRVGEYTALAAFWGLEIFPKGTEPFVPTLGVGLHFARF
jgi:hypothetical protein